MILKTSAFLLRHGTLWTYRLATWAVVVFGLAFAVGVIALRYWLLPNADAWREPVAGTISRAVGQTVRIGGIKGSWDGFRPNLRLRDVRVVDSEGTPSLSLAQVDTVLSWVALLRGELRFHSLEIGAPAVEARRDAEGRVWIAGQPLAAGGGADEVRGGFMRWLLAQRQVVVRDARVVWKDEYRDAPELVLEDAALRVDSVAGRHRFGIRGRLPAELASEFSVRGELSGGAGAGGTIYGELGYANIALLQEWVDLPVDLESATGSTRFWLNLADGRLARATVDANIVNLRGQRKDGTSRLALSRLAGRLVWQSNDHETQLAAQRLTFTTAEGVYLPPVDIRWRQESGADGYGEVAVADIPLAPVAELAHYLPLADALRQRLRDLQPEGVVRSGHIAWSGGEIAPRKYAVELEFRQVAFRPTPSLPGVRGVDGRLQASEGGGTLSLASMSGAFEFPAVFAEPIPFDYLNAEAGWHVEGGVTRVDVRSLSFTNPHAAGNFFGTYTRGGSGPGSVDITGSLVRADARQVWRYLPVDLSHTRNWLRRALKSGQAVNATLRLRGPLERFPYPGGQGGEFEVRAQLEGITLEYAEGWPAIDGASGELLFAGERMQFSATAGRILGIDVSRTRAEIPGIGGRHRERLIVRGEAAGPLEGFVRFIAESPVKTYLGRFSEGLEASGRGALRLALDLPLDHAAEAVVDGEMQIDASAFRVGRRLPPFTEASANVGFSQKGVQIRDGRARLFGSPLRFATTESTGEAMTVALSGRMDVARARDGLNEPMLASLEGASDWRGTLNVRRNATRLLLESDLVGVASRLPAPLDKSADSRLPLRVDLREQAEGRELLALELDTRAAAQLLLREGTVERGTVSFGAPASLPAGSGIRLAGALDALNVAAWSAALRRETGSAVSAVEPLPLVSALDVRIGLLDVRGRQFHDLGLTGTHDGRIWRIAVDGREVKGVLSWAGQRDGRLEARFDKLQIPAPVSRAAVGPAPEPAPERERLPAIDLVADRFAFEGMDLGRLELLADPAAASWTLRRMQISNPDGRLELSGRWTMSAQPKTDLDVKFEAIDAGKLLARLGYPDSLRAGRGTLAGPVSWVGSPARLDLPTLSGRLKLDVRDGRFAQLEPGVGRLLGVLSLQALPRRFAFDFRDVFSSGFSFEKITANVAIDRGVASTEDLLMEGPSARVYMAGKVNLAEENQDLRVRVLPQLSTGVAIAGAMVNPAVGLAALIAQRVLGDPVERIAAVEYKVTGTWAEPHLERVERSQNGGGRN